MTSGNPILAPDPRAVTALASDPRVDLSTPSLERRVRSGAMWSALNTLSTKLGNIAITAVVVRIVSPTDFGVFAAAITIFTVLSSFADWGVSSCLMRGDLDPDEIGPSAALVGLLSGALLGLGMAWSAPALAAAFAAPQAVTPIRTMALCLLIGGVFSVPVAMLTREFRQDKVFLTNIASFVPSNVLLIVLAQHGDGAMAFAWSRVLGSLVSGVVAVLVGKKVYLPRLDQGALRTVLRFGLPLAGANLVNYTLLNADYAFVGHQLGAALLGVYLLAFNVSSWSTSVLSATINSVAMPAFSRVQQDAARLSDALRRSARIVCLLSFPIAALSCALATPLITTVYGEKWRGAIPVVAILAVYGATFVVVSLLSNLLVGVGRTGGVFWIQVAWIVTLIPTMALGVHLDGIRGVAWAHVVILLVVVVPLYLRAMARIAPATARNVARAAAGPLAAAATAGLVAYVVSRALHGPALQLVVGGLAGGVVYLAASAAMFAVYFPQNLLIRRAPAGAPAGRHRRPSDGMSARVARLGPAHRVDRVDA